ncbi:hypothetical protein RhiirA4_449297, partial [Rhizophagus irregularis]
LPGELNISNNSNYRIVTCEILGGSLALSRHGIYSTATPWTDVNFVDDQFLRTLGNTPFLFFSTFQSEG